MNAAFSVLILTLNEEVNLPHALKSAAPYTDDIVILDSLSRDDTVHIARESGARVFSREFDNYAAQRNAGLALDYRHDWVLMLDADEMVTPELVDEIIRAISAADDTYSMFRMRRKDIFLGRWIRRSSGYPTWFGRLVRPGRVTVRRTINEEYFTDGRVGWLREHLVHHPFRRGIEHWVDRHNAYSTLEARELVFGRGGAPSAHIFSRDAVERRRALKRLAFRLPFRPLLVFLYLYVFRLGILDGVAGWYFCRLRATYEFLIDAKMHVMRSSQKPSVDR
jgi:glycosyltransferase involved in cell wall biosynthesis